MPEKTPENLEGLTLGLIATGGIGSLGYEFVKRLIGDSNLTKKGIIGNAGVNGNNSLKGITRILVYNEDTNRSEGLIEEIQNEWKADNPPNLDLKTQYDNGDFKIDYASSIDDLRKETGICFFMYDTVPGDERRAALSKGSKRGISFKPNMKKLYDWQGAFKGYNGLAMFCTNPSDFITYFAPDILGLKRDQCIGLNHVDTYRFRRILENIKIDSLPGITDFSAKEKEKAIKARQGLKMSTAYMIGNHSDDSFGLFSKIMYGDLNEALTESKIFGNPESKKFILKFVHSMAGKLTKKVKGPNDNCIPPMVDLLTGMVTGEGAYGSSYYLKITSGQQKANLETLEKTFKENWKAYLKEKWNKECKEGKREKEFSEEDWEKYHPLDIKGFCTGVPVKFNRDGKIIRPDIADGYKKEAHVIDTRSWNDMQYWKNDKDKEVVMTEKDIFDLITDKNITRIAEAILKKEIEDEHDFIKENIIPILASVQSCKVTFTKKALDTQICEENSKNFPKASAIAAHENRVAVASYQNRINIDIFELPNFDLEGLVKNVGQKIPSKHIDLGEYHNNPVMLMEFLNSTLYLVRGKKIDKRDITNHEKPIITPVTYDFYIKSITINDKEIYCGTTDGIVKVIKDSDLRVIKTYKGAGEGKVIKTKIGELGSLKYLFCCTDLNEIYAWNLEENKSAIKIGKTNNRCFDLAVEQFKNDEILCVYSLDEKYDIRIMPVMKINPEKKPEWILGANYQKEIEKHKDFKKEIRNFLDARNKTKNLLVKGGEIFLLSDDILRSILNKDDKRQEISNPNTDIGILTHLAFVETTI